MTVLDSHWRHLAWLYPLATTWVVAATANHYFLDAIAGIAFVVVPLWLCGLRFHHIAHGVKVVPHRPEPELVSAEAAPA